MRHRVWRIVIFLLAATATGCDDEGIGLPTTSSSAEEGVAALQPNTSSTRPVEFVVSPKGPGCRPGTYTVRTNTNSDTGEMNIGVVFDALLLQTAENTSRELATDCTLTLTLRPRAGVSLALLNVEFQGFGTLAPGVTGNVVTNVGFLPEGFDPDDEERTTILGRGGIDEVPSVGVQHVHPNPKRASQVKWMPCGVARTLDVSVRLSLFAPSEWVGNTSLLKISHQRTHLATTAGGLALAIGSRECG